MKTWMKASLSKRKTRVASKRTKKQKENKHNNKRNAADNK
jgi:hypothetical protein